MIDFCCTGEWVDNETDEDRFCQHRETCFLVQKWIYDEFKNPYPVPPILLNDEGICTEYRKT